MRVRLLPLAWVALSVALAACSGSASPPTATALTKAQAVEAALHADGRAGMRALSAQSGPASEVLPSGGLEWAEVPSANTWVWFVNLYDGEKGSFVVLDYFFGTIYSVQRLIS